jgi:peptidoglycan/xylan/chitin deacetylase (PgdA/CDA1 family)
VPKAAPLVARLAVRSGLAGAVRRVVARRRATAVVYHDPPPARFESHLRYLAANYTFVSLDQIADALEPGQWSRLPDYPLAVTLDDGRRGNAELEGLLREYRCPVTIFACSQILGTARHVWSSHAHDVVELKRVSNAERIRTLVARGQDPVREWDTADRQALSLSEVGRLRDVATFGSHTRFHSLLPACTDDEAHDEVVLARREIEELTGSPCRHFAYPYGEYTARDRALAERAGYRTARTTDVGWIGRDSDPYALRAFSIPDSASVELLAAELAGSGFLWRWRETGHRGGRQPLTAAPAHRRERVAA